MTYNIEYFRDIEEKMIAEEIASKFSLDNVNVTSPTEKQVNNANDIIISTQYGDLYYPDQWTEFVKTEQKSENDVVVVRFGAEINSKVYPLFEVMIGGEGANSVGTLTDSAGTSRNVSINVDEIVQDPDLTEGEQNRLYAMQEDLNYLIDNLK